MDNPQPFLGHQDRKERVVPDGVKGAVDEHVDAATGLTPDGLHNLGLHSDLVVVEQRQQQGLLAVEEAVKRPLRNRGRPRQFINGRATNPPAREGVLAGLLEPVTDPVSLLSGKGPGHLSRL